MSVWNACFGGNFNVHGIPSLSERMPASSNQFVFWKQNLQAIATLGPFADETAKPRQGGELEMRDVVLHSMPSLASEIRHVDKERASFNLVRFADS